MNTVIRLSALLLICLVPLEVFAGPPSPPPPVPGPTGQVTPPAVFDPDLNNKRGGFIPQIVPYPQVVPNFRFDSTKRVSPSNPLTVPGYPGDFPIPMHPWYGVMDPKRVNYGSAIQQIEVPPQQVIVNVYVPGPGSFSGGFEPQLIEIPGYVVTETSTGYIYPARVGLREVTPGVFNWVTEQSVFILK